jgi:16S rRNA (guanine966-N2)-methyltransferase
MRIIGGRLSGRRFGAPQGRGTRPTSDRVREAVASALESRGAFEGARVLDLFAGTGALSFEALSRGASAAVVVDRDPRVLRQVLRSASELDLTSEVRSVRADLLSDPSTIVLRIPEVSGGFDLVFADAPYSHTDSVPGLLAELVARQRLAPGAWVVVEHAASHDWTWPNGLASDAEYRYGHTRISLGFYDSEKGSQ